VRYVEAGAQGRAGRRPPLPAKYPGAIVLPPAFWGRPLPRGL